MINYFQAIQTAPFYKEKVFEMFKSNFNMFLDIRGSIGQNKNQRLQKTDNQNVVSDFCESN